MAGDAIANSDRPYTRPGVTHLLETYGLAVLFLLVGVEGAGVPLPGETALITAAILAANGHYSIVAVIVVAACAAVTGDNTGYWVGRLGGRRLLARTPVVRDSFHRVLPVAERFFRRHGPKTVLVARFIVVLRTTAAWMAGISHMRWRLFFAFDAIGATIWATAVGIVAYVFGKAAANAIGHYGVYAAIGVVIVGAIAFVAFRVFHKRLFGQT
jgi:membrane protein DedA with SNARE-associated domain